MKKITFFLLILLLTGCAIKQESSINTSPAESVPSDSTTAPTETFADTAPNAESVDPIRRILNTMTMEERVGQLFLARCNRDTALEDLEKYHLGGFVLFSADFEGQTPDSVRAVFRGYQNAASIPLLLAVDEEGGTVNRISRFSAFRSKPFPSPRSVYQDQGLDAAVAMEEEKCKLLTNVGINVNIGPVCDLTDTQNAFMFQRSLGAGPEETGKYVALTVAVKNAYRIGSALKHFPGYGDNADTHTGVAADSRSLDSLISRDLIPFHAGVRSGAGCILMSHMVVESLDSQAPASLSEKTHTFLRQELCFDGVILTDDLVMEAVKSRYEVGEAAVLAVLAGNDLLCSTDYQEQYQAVLAAALDGRIDIDVINSAVRHVLQWKIDLGLIDPGSFRLS